MNSLLIAVASMISLVLAYRFYGEKFVKMFGVKGDNVTPAHKNYDGMDYVPAKSWVILFGHHFSSISGAAPVIGPIIAVSIWGWGPALLWVMIGSIFIGGVHDFGSLVISIRHEGRSIADITTAVISRRAKIVFASFVWLTLILVIAVFVYLCAKTLALEPRIVVPSFGLIGVAVIVGYLIYNKKRNHAPVTFFGFCAVCLLVVLGNKFPVRITAGDPQLVWTYALLVYCFIASITPVQILLQPRDYLCAYLLASGILFGYAGVLISHPQMSAPFAAAPGLQGNAMWPMIFVTVACGAVSGFHSLIASGTTAKQISSESHAKRIGYGAMMMEAAVAVLAILVVGAGIENRAALAGFLGKEGSGPIGAFGYGYGEITRPILAGMGGFFAMVVLNGFILTTLDTATRIGRYITHELFGISDRYLATSIVVALSGWLGISGNWAKIWPLFGAANQLVAALALLVITVWLLSRSKNIAYTGIPCAFMLLTTIGAICYKMPAYFRGGDMFLGVMSIVLLGLAAYMLAEVTVSVKRKNGVRHA